MTANKKAPAASPAPSNGGAIMVEMTMKKETKGTYVYEAVSTGSPPAVTSLYVQRWAMPNPPSKIIVVVSPK